MPVVGVDKTDEETEPLGGLAENLVDESLYAEIQQAFNLFDTLATGQINFLQCKVAFRALGLSSSDESIIEIFDKAGKTPDESLNYSEFQALVTSIIDRRCNKKEAEKIFHLLKGENNVITPESLFKIANQLGESISMEEIELMIMDADTTNRGCIGFDDFFQVLRSTWCGDYFD